MPNLTAVVSKFFSETQLSIPRFKYKLKQLKYYRIENGEPEPSFKDSDQFDSPQFGWFFSRPILQLLGG